MTSTKKGISACELQRQIGHKRYATIWSVMHRLRGIMGKREALYRLSDMIEFDEGYFEQTVPQNTKQNLKRGRGSQRKVNVAVMAESVPLEDISTGVVSNQCRYFKMFALENHKSELIREIIEGSIDLNSVIFTDKSTSYLGMENYIEVHIAEKSSRHTTVETLKWGHIAISNAKRTLLGIHHKINGEFLQSYLNEFTYKLNRRYLDSLFDRLLVASVYRY